MICSNLCLATACAAACMYVRKFEQDVPTCGSGYDYNVLTVLVVVVVRHARQQRCEYSDGCCQKYMYACIHACICEMQTLRVRRLLQAGLELWM